MGCGACVGACPQGAISMNAGVAETDRTRCNACGACVSSCPQEARRIAGATWRLSDLLPSIKADRAFYEESGGGVTLSGGEPLAQPDAAIALLEASRAAGFHTAVDTCGLADRAVFETLAPLVDLFLYDVKMLDETDHIAFTGASNRPILENLAYLDSIGARIWIRTPVLPGINDKPRQLQALAERLASCRHVESLQLLPYHRGGLSKLEQLGRSTSYGATPPSSKAMQQATRLLQAHLSIPVCIGGQI